MTGYKRRVTHHIRSYEVDKNQRLSMERLVNFAQDIAMAQGEALGVGQNTLIDQNLAWIIVKFDIQLERYPIYKEEIQVTTQPVGFHKLTADRRFWFTNQEGHVIGSIASQWVMVDVTKGRIKGIPEFYPKKYGFDFTNNEKISYERFQLPDSWDITSELQVKYSDLDFNNHVNNGVYLRWMLDGLPEGFLDIFGVKRLQVSFKKAARLGDRVFLRTTLPQEERCHSFVEIASQGGEPLAQARIDWVDFSE